MSLTNDISRLVNSNDETGLTALLDLLKTANQLGSAPIQTATTNDKDIVKFTGVYDLSALLNRKNSHRYTLLHVAIFHRHLGIVKLLTDNGADINTKCHGSHPLHLILSMATLPNADDFTYKCFQLLLEKKHCCVTIKDDQNNLPIHLAAELPNSAYLELLLTTLNNNNNDDDDDDEALKICLEAKDRVGLRPLHRSVAKDAIDCATLLLKQGASVNSTNIYGTTALHLAAEHGHLSIYRLLVANGANEGAKDKYGRTPNDIANISCRHESPHRTLIITDASCSFHHTCSPSEACTTDAPPENKHRLSILMHKTHGVLRSSDLAHVIIQEESRAATISDVLRVHEWNYIREIQAICETLEGDELGRLDGDTSISRQSYQAALHASGAVCNAIDLVVKNEIKNAFCAIRPPGHHSGPKGVVGGDGNGPDSHGFCLLNNIAIGAAYALHVHRNNIKKVVIVDFDVHHGNGTEECVRWLVPRTDSINLLRNDCFGTLSVPKYKPWLDETDTDNVLFVSVHGYGPREKGLEHLMPHAAFYPGSGKTVYPDIDGVIETRKNIPKLLMSNNLETLGDIAMLIDKSTEEAVDGDEANDENFNEDDDNNEDDNDNDDDDDGDDDAESNNIDENGCIDDNLPELSNSKTKLNNLKSIYGKPLSNRFSPPLILDVGLSLSDDDIDDDVIAAANYRIKWRDEWRNQIFPRLMAFQPDLVLISAGFDAHKKDTINAGYLSLVEEDFEWVTRNLVRIANSTCGGKVVSALEGGYQLGGEHCSAFAKSVKAHVNALSVGAQSSHLYIQADVDIESSVEQKAIEEMELRRAAKYQREEQERAEIASALAIAENANQEVVSGEDIVDALVSMEKEDEKGDQISAEIDEGSSRKRRRSSKPVDYAALDKALKGE